MVRNTKADAKRREKNINHLYINFFTTSKILIFFMNKTKIKVLLKILIKFKKSLNLKTNKLTVVEF